DDTGILQFRKGEDVKWQTLRRDQLADFPQDCSRAAPCRGNHWRRASVRSPTIMAIIPKNRYRAAVVLLLGLRLVQRRRCAGAGRRPTVVRHPRLMPTRLPLTNSRERD